MPTRHDPADDEFLFRQGPARGLGSIRFHDWRAAYAARAEVPNVARFTAQADGLRELLATHPPGEEQQGDLDFLLALGQLFALVVYGQLILEQAGATGLDADLLDQIFDILVRDFAGHAIELHGKTDRHGRPGSLGAGPGPSPGRRRGPRRQGLVPGGGPRRPLRDDPLIPPVVSRGGMPSGWRPVGRDGVPARRLWPGHRGRFRRAVPADRHPSHRR